MNYSSLGALSGARFPPSTIQQRRESRSCPGAEASEGDGKALNPEDLGLGFRGLGFKV